jgi:hypothetical protein
VYLWVSASRCSCAPWVTSSASRGLDETRGVAGVDDEQVAALCRSRVVFIHRETGPRLVLWPSVHSGAVPSGWGVWSCHGYAASAFCGVALPDGDVVAVGPLPGQPGRTIVYGAR